MKCVSPALISSAGLDPQNPYYFEARCGASWIMACAGVLGVDEFLPQYLGYHQTTCISGAYEPGGFFPTPEDGDFYWSTSTPGNVRFALNPPALPDAPWLDALTTSSEHHPTIVGVGGGGASITLRYTSPPDARGIRSSATVTKSLTVVKIDLLNPVDTNGNGYVDDFASAGGTGNAFGYDRSQPTTLTTCCIPCRVRISPDTGEIRALFAGQVTATLDSVSCSTLTWDPPAGGSLVYNGATGLWEAVATYTGVPRIPALSYGHVPQGIHDALYGSRTASVSASGGGISFQKNEPYEVYYGDSLQIAGTKMADTTRNWQVCLNSLIAGDPLRMEIYEKMNCATAGWSFETQDKAQDNFAMRCWVVYRIEAIVDDAADYGATWNGPSHAKCNDCIWNNGWQWGTYWKPAPPGVEEWSNKFVEMDYTLPQDAVVHITPFIGECEGVKSIVLYEADHQVLGDARFHNVHVQNGLNLGLNWDPLLVAPAASDIKSFLPGDFLYMQNQPDYPCDNPLLPWHGENCFYMGWGESYIGTFLGFGMDDQMTEADLKEMLAEEYGAALPNNAFDLSRVGFVDHKYPVTGE